MPVETAARELDAKLLLALHAVDRGMPVVVGNRALMNQVLHRFPPGIYLSHNFDRRRRRILRIADLLGHRVVAWDEEGLVWIDGESYRARRAAPATLSHVDTVYAWGPAHAEALKPATDNAGVDVVATGNPRADLLGPKLRDLYAAPTAQLTQRYGDFILINSNFGWLNYAPWWRQSAES